MEWDMRRLIGYNARERRLELGLEVGEFGDRMEQALGRPWKRQTVSAMENGNRAMSAEDVAAMAVVLRVPVVRLFAPPAENDTVRAGLIEVPAETLLPATREQDQLLVELALHLRALDHSRQELMALAQEQWTILEDARNALLGVETTPADSEDYDDANDSGLKRTAAALSSITRARAERHYDRHSTELPDAADVLEPKTGDEDHG